jgi:electron transfer flavoprotein beta subunit
MNTIVILKMVPDVVEELEIAGDGKGLEAEALRMILSESSDHALEQALLLKEKQGGKVTVAVMEGAEVDDALFTALAKGADRAVKLTSEEPSLGTVAASGLFASWLAKEGTMQAEDTLVLTGSQAIDDLEGELAPCLAELVQLPFLGVVTGLTVDGPKTGLVAIKEFAGGLRGEFQLPMHAVVGVQAAEKPPRYVPVAKVRAVMKSAKLESVAVASPEAAPVAVIEKMYKPEVASRAEMLEGTPEEITNRCIGILTERGLL